MQTANRGASNSDHDRKTGANKQNTTPRHRCCAHKTRQQRCAEPIARCPTQRQVPKPKCPTPRKLQSLKLSTEMLKSKQRKRAHSRVLHMKQAPVRGTLTPTHCVRRAAAEYRLCHPRLGKITCTSQECLMKSSKNPLGDPPSKRFARRPGFRQQHSATSPIVEVHFPKHDR